MTSPCTVEVTRGGYLESLHHVQAVVMAEDGQVQAQWGEVNTPMFPRSSSKMIQALPLVESGAASAHGLSTRHLALACASHQGAALHRAPVNAWLADLGLDDTALRCGPQEPRDLPERDALIQAGESPCQAHNNCSGKHAGFLTLTRHLGAGPEYVDPDHPIQKAILERWQDVTDEQSPGFGIDGCSAPNHATTLAGLARAMAHFACAQDTAAAQLRDAMMAHPDLVAGEGRACTELMRALPGQAALKTGAEGVFVAILPQAKLGIAVKAQDGATRAAEATITALLTRYAGLEATHPSALKRTNATIRNWAGQDVGQIHAKLP